jgi:hypothetical protein
MTRAGNSNSNVNVRTAEDRADAEFGISSLVVGFAIQAGVAVWSTGHAPASASGGWSYLVTAGWLAVPVALVLIVARRTRWRRIRNYLIELARYADQTGEHFDDPSIRELESYGRILEDEGRARQYDEAAEDYETAEDYAVRVWKVDRTR